MEQKHPEPAWCRKGTLGEPWVQPQPTQRASWAPQQNPACTEPPAGFLTTRPSCAQSMLLVSHRGSKVPKGLLWLHGPLRPGSGQPSAFLVLEEQRKRGWQQEGHCHHWKRSSLRGPSPSRCSSSPPLGGAAAVLAPPVCAHPPAGPRRRFVDTHVAVPCSPGYFWSPSPGPSPALELEQDGEGKHKFKTITELTKSREEERHQMQRLRQTEAKLWSCGAEERT